MLQITKNTVYIFSSIYWCFGGLLLILLILTDNVNDQEFKEPGLYIYCYIAQTLKIFTKDFYSKCDIFQFQLHAVFFPGR